ncbi:hypothetical protein FRC00_003666 [Tulasnella sp. 408]|nr:hypothetical protein FRC00_003666 [Tulasnella sp. 408]
MSTTDKLTHVMTLGQELIRQYSNLPIYLKEIDSSGPDYEWSLIQTAASGFISQINDLITAKLRRAASQAPRATTPYYAMEFEEGRVEQALNEGNAEDTEEDLGHEEMALDRSPSPQLPEDLGQLATVTEATQVGLQHHADPHWSEYLGVIRKYMGRVPGNRLVVQGNPKIEALSKVQWTLYRMIP